MYQCSIWWVVVSTEYTNTKNKNTKKTCLIGDVRGTHTEGKSGKGIEGIEGKEAAEQEVRSYYTCGDSPTNLLARRGASRQR